MREEAAPGQQLAGRVQDRQQHDRVPGGAAIKAGQDAQPRDEDNAQDAGPCSRR
ncbi:hypothetical protein GCM10018773_56890 [Streptomyces candidus]|nr:hypothetical protein GCM10018773_56890 [Streptomyces candidus]